MYVEPSAYDDVVVLIKYNGEYNYFVSYKEMWILSYHKLSMINSNIKFDLEEERIDFYTLDENNIKEFIVKNNKYMTSFSELKEYYKLFEATKTDNESDIEILPVFFVDFDSRVFHSFYTEPGSYEDNIPDGWKGNLHMGNWSVIEKEYRYWEK